MSSSQGTKNLATDLSPDGSYIDAYGTDPAARKTHFVETNNLKLLD